MTSGQQGLKSRVVSIYTKSQETIVQLFSSNILEMINFIKKKYIYIGI